MKGKGRVGNRDIGVGNRNGKFSKSMWKYRSNCGIDQGK